jgi:hypothetical protein
MIGMDTNSHAIVGIAGHYDPASGQGGWAVVLRVDGRELVLHGQLPGSREAGCEQYSIRQAISALRRLRAPLRAIEVTSDLKQAVIQPHLRGRQARAWAPAREWWKSVAHAAGVRVTRKPNDTYSAARRMAEIAALTGAEKIKLLDEELDTPWNREHQERKVARQAEASERRADRAGTEHDGIRESDKVNEYAIAKGRESPPQDYRPRPAHVVALPMFQRADGAPTSSIIPGLAETHTLEEVISLLERM